MTEVATGGSDARAAVLGRIRAANRGQPTAGPIPRDYALTGELSDPGRAAALLDLFAERVADYRATVVRCPPGELATNVAVQLRRLAVRHVAVAPEVPADWHAGLDVEVVRDGPGLGVAELDAVDAALTGCAVGIAETGTVALDGSGICGRRVLTLILDIHLCVILADQIVASVPEALARLEPTDPLTLISGPSATSDIELKRVEGVHGPRTLVVLIQD